MLTKDKKQLTDWFSNIKRELPWRKEPRNPYSVWVSEVMLQQTQVSVVVPYFQRWMDRFPTISSLAEAPLDDVIKTWEGLGYYSRARNLHNGAQTVCRNFESKLPSTPQELQTIKGLGPYTIGAILSFAFHKKAPAVDGNVIRVLARYFALEDDISLSSTKKKIEQLAISILPNAEPWFFNEALIELGALICQKQPQCHKCPLQSSCKGYASGRAASLPIKTKKTAYEELFRGVAVISHDEHFLIRRGKPGEIMRDLYEFPYLDATSPDISSRQVFDHFDQKWPLQLTTIHPLNPVKHSFTRYRVQIIPYRLICQMRHTPQDFEWVSFTNLKNKPFSSGHRRILKQVIS